MDSWFQSENLETPDGQCLIELVYVKEALTSVGKIIVARNLAENLTEGPARQPATDQASSRSSRLDAEYSNAECFSQREPSLLDSSFPSHRRKSVAALTHRTPETLLMSL